MEHKEIKELIHLFISEELNEADELKVQEHLAVCSECSNEYKNRQKLLRIINADKLEADESLLQKSRAELHRALISEKNKSPFISIILNKIKTFFLIQYKPVFGSAAILIAGFILGYFLNQNNAENNLPISDGADPYSLLENNIKISNVRFIDNDLSDGSIEFEFDAIKPMRIKGGINDQKIQTILTHSMLNEENPGVRLNSITAMGNAGNNQLDDEVKNALINVAQYDENPGVKREALKLLREFPYDEKIKQALLYVLQNDSTAGLRIEAINSLVEAKKQGIKFDNDDLSIFKNKILEDENNYIRHQAKFVIEEL
jgi:hypothetical protein